MFREYRGLWSLLVIAFFVMAIRVVDFPVPHKKNIAKTEKPIQAYKSLTDSSSRPRRYLFIGDSMIEGIYPRLSAWTKANGDTLNTVIWYGSTTQWWVQDTLEHFINKYEPQFIFISLGSNELFVKDLSPQRKSVKEIIRTIGEKPFLWIGPPSAAHETGIIELLHSTLPERNFFKSERLTLRRTSDGIHPNRQAASAWADSIVSYLQPLFPYHPVFAKAKPTTLDLLQPLH